MICPNRNRFKGSGYSKPESCNNVILSAEMKSRMEERARQDATMFPQHTNGAANTNANTNTNTK